jgi:hypothetical protein
MEVSDSVGSDHQGHGLSSLVVAVAIHMTRAFYRTLPSLSGR